MEKCVKMIKEKRLMFIDRLGKVREVQDFRVFKGDKGEDVVILYETEKG